MAGSLGGSVGDVGDEVLSLVPNCLAWLCIRALSFPDDELETAVPVVRPETEAVHVEGTAGLDARLDIKLADASRLCPDLLGPPWLTAFNRSCWSDKLACLS